MAAGASLYMTKPFAPQAFAGEVRALLERQHGGERAAPARGRPAVSDGDDEFIAGFIDDYFAECDEHLDVRAAAAADARGSARRRGADPKILDELFQAFHSLKGISGMVELRDAEMLAHEMESYLRALRQRETALSQAGVDALIGGVDALERVVAARRDNRASPPVGSAMRAIAAVVPARRRPRAAAPAPARGTGRVRAVDRDVHAVGRAQRARGERRHDPGAPSRARDDPARGAEDPRHRHRVRVRVRRRSR